MTEQRLTEFALTGSANGWSELRSAALKASILLVLLIASPESASSDGPDVVGHGVREVISSEGEARVLVVVGQRAVNANNAGAKGQSIAEEVIGSASGHGFEVLRRFGHIAAFAAHVDAKALEKLAHHPRVRRIDLDAGGRGFLTESRAVARFDPPHIAGVRGTGARVAILDSGINGAHPDLGGAIVDEACFCSGGDGCCPDGSTTQFGLGADQDDNGHGSNVAGVVISDGFVSPLGAAPDTEIVSVKVLDDQASFCCSSDVVAGLDWLIANHTEIDVVNLSLGTPAIFPGDCDDATSFTMSFSAAITTLRGLGIVTVSSSGNDGSGTSMSAPACVADTISAAAAWDGPVGAQLNFGCADPATVADQITCFSNTSPTLDLVVSGNPMTSSGLFANTSTFVGTSNAAPLISACAALIRGIFPSITASELETALETSAVQVTDATNGLSYPRLDCMDALVAAGWSPPPSVPGATLGWLAALLGLVGAVGIFQSGVIRRHNTRTGTIS